MREINEFVAQFDSRILLDKSLIFKNRNRYYLLSRNLKQQVPKDFFYAGTYLGAVKSASFFPSFPLLKMIAESKANKTVIDKKTAWLFICGRDIFKKGIVKENRLKKGNYTLILNEHNECLGFGKTLHNIREENNVNRVVIKNILDIGDFLRREKRKSKRQNRSSKLLGRNRNPRNSSSK